MFLLCSSDFGRSLEESRDDLQSLGYDTPVPLIRSDSYTTLLDATPPWSGDVWKAIVHLRSTRDDLQVAVLDCDRGVGLVRKGAPTEQLPYTAAQIEDLDYDDLAADRTRLLNLQRPSYFHDFMAARRL